jgi:rhodanese-related sulfurtransferase
MNATALPPLDSDTTMSALLQAYPGAQRALFAHYHIGGCKSCGFNPTETLGQVCARNENIPVDEAIAHIQSSHDSDAQLQVSPTEFEAMRCANPELKILDVRMAEEHEAVKIPGAHLFSQALLQTIFDSWDKTQPLIIYDHMGTRSLDVVAYFMGHGFGEAKALAGGIEAYSLEVDSSLPRYRLEIED